MIRACLPLLALLLLCGCSAAGIGSVPAAPAGEVEAVERAVREGFFGAIERLDLDALSAAVTPDFELVEDTVRLDLAGFRQLVEPFRGRATVSYRLFDFRTEVHGDAAWTSYRNRAVMRMQGQQTELEWLETAVLLRSGGGWRIDRLQSTPVHPR